MKTIRLLTFPSVFIGLLLMATFPFQSCDPDDDENDADTNIVVYKPNIYMYPQVKMQLAVKLNFPSGGGIVASIPEYGTGWNVTVDTSGLINDKFTYLFYESKQPDIWQQSEGWIVKRADLEGFFKKNMSNYGFLGNEIQDFIDYWISRLTDYEFYAIYPQNALIISDVIELSFSKQPDNLLRLFYLIRRLDYLPSQKLTEPKIDLLFEREGFFVVEWGVILK